MIKNKCLQMLVLLQHIINSLSIGMLVGARAQYILRQMFLDIPIKGQRFVAAFARMNLIQVGSS